MLKDFTGWVVYSSATCCRDINNKIVEKTIRKAFPDDNDSTLYIVKLKGVRNYKQLYEDEMLKQRS